MLIRVYTIAVMGNDANIDAAKNKVNPVLWREMRASAIQKQQKIHEWLEEAIRLNLQMEKDKKDVMSAD